MRKSINLLAGVLLISSVPAQQTLLEPPEFPGSLPGPEILYDSGQCMLLARGRISPGDVDWLRVKLPLATSQTVIDVDFSEGQGNSLLLVDVLGGVSLVNMNDGNLYADTFCGLDSDTLPVGSTLDNAADLGPTPADTTIELGITGFGDHAFRGDHSEDFSYEVWIFSVIEIGGCAFDTDCDDLIECTFDYCDVATGTCLNEPDDGFCDNGLFCDGAEWCDPGNDCQLGSPPCEPEEVCDEVDGCLTVIQAAMDIRPESCPNWLNRRSNGILSIALVGSAELEVDQVDTSTLLLARADGIGGTVSPETLRGQPRAELKDATGQTDVEPCDCDKPKKDGVDDLVIRFRRSSIVSSLGLDRFVRGDVVELTLTGTMLDGTLFWATDCVTLVP